ALYHANGEINDRVAFILDEAARLGNMSLIPVARDAGRKYGITLVMVYQSLGQLREQWGGKDAVSDWFESTSWQSFSAITDVDT
ncbi:TraM recognition domain-containing protein, partial [Escherichia coli]|uniref:type IV secretory system conjugative DNA transfer family protein n=1 Tax=Escherichia coli TaxID=562 RepID=UPI003892B573